MHQIHFFIFYWAAWATIFGSYCCSGRMQPLWPRPLMAQETCKAQLLSRPLLTTACTMATACTHHTVVSSSMQRHFCMRIDGAHTSATSLVWPVDKKGEGLVNKTRRPERNRVQSVKIIFFSSSMHPVARSFFLLRFTQGCMRSAVCATTQGCMRSAVCATEASAAIFWSRLRKSRRRSSGRARDFYTQRVVHGILRQWRRDMGAETWEQSSWNSIPLNCVEGNRSLSRRTVRLGQRPAGLTESWCRSDLAATSR
jgi:hypothetical protein